MVTTSLLAEFLLIGLIPFFTISFFVLIILGVDNLSFFSQVKDYFTPLAVLIALCIYLLGALTHRICQIVNVQSLRYLWKFKLLKAFEQLFEKSDKWHEDYYFVYQYGSDKLCDKITYNESLLRVFKSVALTSPILTVVLTIWLSRAVGPTGVWTSTLIGLLIFLAAVIAIPIQYQNYRQIIESSAGVIKKFGHNK